MAGIDVGQAITDPMAGIRGASSGGGRAIMGRIRVEGTTEIAIESVQDARRADAPLIQAAAHPQAAGIIVKRTDTRIRRKIRRRRKASECREIFVAPSDVQC